MPAGVPTGQCQVGAEHRPAGMTWQPGLGPAWGMRAEKGYSGAGTLCTCPSSARSICVCQRSRPVGSSCLLRRQAGGVGDPRRFPPGLRTLLSGQRTILSRCHFFFLIVTPQALCLSLGKLASCDRQGTILISAGAQVTVSQVWPSCLGLLGLHRSWA